MGWVTFLFQYIHYFWRDCFVIDLGGGGIFSLRWRRRLLHRRDGMCHDDGSFW